MLRILLAFKLFNYLHLVSSMTYSCNSKVACGCSSNPAVITKVIGGENAASNTWGWAVSLYIDETNLCGGTIISSSWLITAAHCVHGMEPFQIIVSAATNRLYGLNQWRYASSVIWHPQFNNNTFENDIALIEVSPPFNMTDPGIAKICLPMMTKEDFPSLNSSLVAIGWGLLTENGNISEILQQVTLQRIEYENYRCYYLITNDSNQFCAGIKNGSKGVCAGDSGGALMMFTSTQQWIIVGIVSYGYRCASADYANTYTRIVRYLEWIRSMNISDAITVQPNTASIQAWKSQIERILIYLLINILLWHLF